MRKKKTNSNQSEQTLMDSETLFQNLIEDYVTVQDKKDKVKEVRRGIINKSDFIADAKLHIESFYYATEESMNDALELFDQYIFGYFRLTPLIEAKDVTDIRCISFDNVRVKVNGMRKESDITFSNKEEYINFVDYIATKNHVSLSNHNAIQRFTDNHSSEDFILRFTVSMPLINTYGEPYLVIRKTPKKFPEIEKLIEDGMIPQELAGDLIERFRNGSTLICGGNSSGKTTILNALKETLPDDMAVLITQQAEELTSKRHPDTMFLHSLPETEESSVSYNLEDISLAGLTMDVDFFIVGEIKGAEAMYVLNAAYTGQLCAATIHAPSADKGADKMTDYSMQESRYSKNELMKMYASCFKNIIFMKKYKVEQLYEISGWDEKTKEIKYTPIYIRRDS